MVWIEILSRHECLGNAEKSPPARVVWIEINIWLMVNNTLWSPPARVVWIEIDQSWEGQAGGDVATRE